MKCKNKLHELPANSTRCRECKRQTDYRRRALLTDAGLCENGHGMVAINVDPNGLCVECLRTRRAGADKVEAPPAQTWLDWALVDQVMNGKPPVRELTKRELLCLAATMRTRHGHTLGDSEIVKHINEHTMVPGIYLDYLKYVQQRWANTKPARALKYLVLTVDEAAMHEVNDTLDDLNDWEANLAQARVVEADEAA